MLVPLSRLTLRLPSVKITDQSLRRLSLRLPPLSLRSVRASSIPATSSRIRLAVLLFQRPFPSSRLRTSQWMWTPTSSGCAILLQSLRKHTFPWTSVNHVTLKLLRHLCRLCKSGAMFVRSQGVTVPLWTAGGFTLLCGIGPAQQRLLPDQVSLIGFVFSISDKPGLCICFATSRSRSRLVSALTRLRTSPAWQRLPMLLLRTRTPSASIGR